MRLCNIGLRDYRNYEALSLEFDPGVNLIVGDNAQGKTNLREAIAYLGSGRSFRAQKTGEMIRFGADFADISGDVFSQERQQSLRWVLFSGSRPRQLYRNGAKKRTAGEKAHRGRYLRRAFHGFVLSGGSDGTQDRRRAPAAAG